MTRDTRYCHDPKFIRNWRFVLPKPHELNQIPPSVTVLICSQIKGAVRKNAMLTWAPSKAKNDLPILTRGEGVYLYDIEGKR